MPTLLCVCVSVTGERGAPQLLAPAILEARGPSPGAAEPVADLTNPTLFLHALIDYIKDC